MEFNDEPCLCQVVAALSRNDETEISEGKGVANVNKAGRSQPATMTVSLPSVLPLGIRHAERNGYGVEVFRIRERRIVVPPDHGRAVELDNDGVCEGRISPDKKRNGIEKVRLERGNPDGSVWQDRLMGHLRKTPTRGERDYEG